MRWLMAVAFGLAAWLLFPGPVNFVGRNRGFRSKFFWLGLVILSLVLVGRQLNSQQLFLLLLASLVSGAVLGLLNSRRKILVQQKQAKLVASYCEALAAELLAGVPPQQALGHIKGDYPEFAVIAEQVKLGTSLEIALTELSHLPGFTDLKQISAAWIVSQQTGAAFSDSLQQTAKIIRNKQSAWVLAKTELSGAVATGWLMVALPMLALIGGQSLGLQPVDFLLTNWVGNLCLTCGLLGLLSGHWWLQRLALSVLR